MFKLIKKKCENLFRRLRRISIDAPKISNVEYNRKLWDDYAKDWEKKNVPLEDEHLRKSEVTVLGEEWGAREDVSKVIQEFILPHINEESRVAEIGTGGGRIASVVAGQVKEFTCFDISAEMLRRVKETLRNYSNVQYQLLKQPKFPGRYRQHFDFIYSFDVFVHLDLHTIWQYMREFEKCLKNTGKVFLHTTNLLAPDGWQRFFSQNEYNIEGHYFVSPEIIKTLANRSGFKIIHSSHPDQTNFYYNRDYLFILEKI